MGKKINKTLVLEIGILLAAFCALGIYCAPKLLHKQEALMAAKIKADGSAFSTKVLSEFSQNKGIKASEAAQKAVDELNSTATNPYNKKAPAYTFEKECKGCNSVEFDDSLEMVIVTTYDKKGDLMARTVVKPPSFVTYTKNDK